MADYPQETLFRLLDLQAEDTAIQRLEERRAELPEAKKLDEVQQRLAMLESDLSIAAKQLSEIEREHNKLEGEIELLEGKTAKEEQRMFSGGISNPKELANLQSEVESLKRRRSGIEDQLLEVMEQREQATATVEKLTSERDDTTAQATELGQTVAALTAEIATELAQHSSARESIAPEIPPEILKIYDRLRSQKAGIGAAALKAGTCEGCHTKLPQREWERIRAEKGLQRCENCRRIVVVHD